MSLLLKKGNHDFLMERIAAANIRSKKIGAGREIKRIES
jgi:hypothetical protein